MSAVLQPGGAAGATPGALAGELLAAAEDLDHQAAAAEAPAVRTDGRTDVQLQPVDWRAEAHDLVDFSTGMFFPLYPRLATVWTAERCTALETRLAAVLQKHNLDMGKLLGKWGPEIMLAATIAPAVLPTVKAIKADLADLRAAELEASRAAPATGQGPAVRTDVQGPAAPADTLQLHQAASSPSSPASQAAPPAAPPDTAQLHSKA